MKAMRWQPIKTAPRDGSCLRLKRVYEGHVVTEGEGFFGTVTIQYTEEDGGPQTFTDEWVTSDGKHFFPSPTHWVAL